MQIKSQPEKLTEQLWNCSVPFWTDFILHFRCNRLKQCVLGEDERECPYVLCESGGRHYNLGKILIEC